MSSLLFGLVLRRGIVCPRPSSSQEAADVLLDGNPANGIDVWIPEHTEDADYWHVRGLPQGRNTVKITARADADPRSLGKKLQIVRALVYGPR